MARKKFLRPKPNSYQSRYPKRSPDVVKLPSKDLVMGPVKILKREEKYEPGLGLCSPEIEVHDLMVSDSGMFYAGPDGFHASPPPSSLPLPSFLSSTVKKF